MQNLLTDRDERALVAAAENRIGEPLRLGAAQAAVRRALHRILVRRSPAPEEARESLSCQPTRRTHPPQSTQPVRSARSTHPAAP
ncbi:hypothetical protein AB0F11_17505 [Streptomyces sp. NPDC032472]|uniref:hypothetical protein n=1 Tax=Streptomyces sp. NPDC032472 TaxID=3155018 RepID=UPI0033FB047E